MVDHGAGLWRGWAFADDLGLNMKITLAIASIILATSADAKCTAHDKWTGHDKQLHFIAGSAIALGVTAQTRDPWKGFAYGAGVGLVKEALDAGGSGTCSAQDLAITVIGAGVGAYFGGKLILAPNYIGYRTEF